LETVTFIATSERDTQKWWSVNVGSYGIDFSKLVHSSAAKEIVNRLAPKFFPLWDRAIAKAYRCELGNVGTNGVNYSAFFLTAVLQARTLSPTMPGEANLLKRIDEYNYCKHTKVDVTAPPL
jgi:hypothetical protein